MKVICLHDKTKVESFLLKDVFLHLYSLGDLDDFFWPYTTWYALQENAEVRAIALIYTGQPLPTLLALSRPGPAMQELLRSIVYLLPRRFYAHLSPGLEGLLEDDYRIHPHGPHYRMALKDTAALLEVDCAGVVRLGRQDLDDILRLYGSSYPDNWFDPRMLQSGQYFGLRRGQELVAVAGIHVYSERYGVAALGNIATHPERRRRGYARLVTARLCQSLCERVDHIGLNVKADNRAAVSLYRGLGLEVVAAYGEFLLEAR